jgi:hypothetical protein
MAKYGMKTLNIYLTDAQHTELKAYAKEKSCSISKAIRGLVPIGQDGIRDWRADGHHTAEAKERTLIDRLLSGKS